MKKLILVLAIALCASQAFGVLDVYLERQGTSNVVDVKYSGAGTTTATRPRAFALELTITGGTFDSFVSGSHYQGESTAANPKYGIYPATIDIDSAGTVIGYGTPQAVNGDPGAGVGFTTDTLVLEFGSLYVGEVNAPAASGTLCSLNFTSGSEITMVDEDTYRGGLVFEDGSQGAVSDTLVLTTPPSPATIPVPANGSTNVDLTTDISWTAGAGATGHDVYFGTAATPPLVSSNQPGTTYDTGTMAGNKTYYCKVIEKNSAGESVALTWNFHTNCLYTGRVFSTTCGGFPPSVNLTVTAAMVTNWTTLGKPAAWCCDAQKCGNVANNIANARADVADLALVKGAWLKSVGQAGYNAAADTNLSGRVDVADLAAVKNHWLKNVGLCLTSY